MMGAAMIENVLIIGGSGNLGPSILAGLQAENFVVSVLSRKNSTATYPETVKVLRIDDAYPEDELREAFRDQDAIICALSLQNTLQQIKFVNVATTVGVKWFIPSEYGGNSIATKGLNIAGLTGQKEEVVDRLQKAESEGLSWTGIATGPFIDWGLANGFLGYNIANKKATIYGSGDQPWTGTTLSTIGLAVARVLRAPESFQNRLIFVYTTQTTQNELLSAFETVTSTKWEVDKVEWDDEPSTTNPAKSARRLQVLGAFFKFGMGADFATDVDASISELGISVVNATDLVTGVLSQLSKK